MYVFHKQDGVICIYCNHQTIWILHQDQSKMILNFKYFLSLLSVLHHIMGMNPTVFRPCESGES